MRCFDDNVRPASPASYIGLPTNVLQASGRADFPEP